MTIQISLTFKEPFFTGLEWEMGWNFVFLSKLHARNKVNSDNFSWFTFFQLETFMVLYCFRFIWNESDECYCSIETSNLKFVNKHAFQMK